MLVAAIGPAVTAALIAVFVGASWLLLEIGAPPLVIVVAEWLAVVNLLLLVFNLIPAFPLDGGRILRGFLWSRTKNRTKATVAAARAGRFFAVLLIGVGVLDLFFLSAVGGLWLMLIGWFLDTAARGEANGEQARHALEGVLVGDVMSKNPVIVPSWITVELLVDQYVMGHQFTSFPTHSIDGRIDGLVTMRGIKQVPPQQRGNRRAIDIAIPVDRVPTARQDEQITDLLKRIGPRVGWPGDGLRRWNPCRHRLAERRCAPLPWRPGTDCRASGGLGRLAANAEEQLPEVLPAVQLQQRLREVLDPADDVLDRLQPALGDPAAISCAASA